MPKIKPASPDDQFTLVEHLDELRFRLIVCIVVFLVALGLCIWQSDLVLEIANRPLPDGFEPITFAVGEPFITTITVAAYAALVISLPVILYQVYAFILPALTPRERHVARPMVVLVPLLFLAGVAFAYFAVMPAATKFLLGFNATEFKIEVRAKDYYSFFGLTLLSLGVLFQVPVVILALTRLGVTTPDMLARYRRYAVLVIAVIAMLLPGTDPVTMLISMVPLYLLYEGSIVLARVAGSPRPEEAKDPPTATPDPG